MHAHTGHFISLENQQQMVSLPTPPKQTPENSLASVPKIQSIRRIPVEKKPSVPFEPSTRLSALAPLPSRSTKIAYGSPLASTDMRYNECEPASIMDDYVAFSPIYRHSHPTPLDARGDDMEIMATHLTSSPGNYFISRFGKSTIARDVSHSEDSAYCSDESDFFTFFPKFKPNHFTPSTLYPTSSLSSSSSSSSSSLSSSSSASTRISTPGTTASFRTLHSSLSSSTSSSSSSGCSSPLLVPSQKAHQLSKMFPPHGPRHRDRHRCTPAPAFPSHMPPEKSFMKPDSNIAGSAQPSRFEDLMRPSQARAQLSVNRPATANVFSRFCRSQESLHFSLRSSWSHR